MNDNEEKRMAGDFEIVPGRINESCANTEAVENPPGEPDRSVIGK